MDNPTPILIIEIIITIIISIGVVKYVEYKNSQHFKNYAMVIEGIIFVSIVFFIEHMDGIGYSTERRVAGLVTVLIFGLLSSLLIFLFEIKGIKLYMGYAFVCSIALITYWLIIQPTNIELFSMILIGCGLAPTFYVIELLFPKT